MRVAEVGGRSGELHKVASRREITTAFQGIDCAAGLSLCSWRSTDGEGIQALWKIDSDAELSLVEFCQSW
jgi:hypothetical protein